jgi:hypothetical protein
MQKLEHCAWNSFVLSFLPHRGESYTAKNARTRNKLDIA